MSSELCPNCGQPGFVPPGPCDICGCVVCPQCMHPNFVAPGPCDGCGYSEKRTCVVSLEDGSVVRVMNLRTRFDQSWARGYFPEDAQFWDRNCQFYIDFVGQDWVIESGTGVNDTMVNGRAVPNGSQQALVDGDRIAVGKESKGIEKTILLVSFA